jgi:hypothetical protein
VTARIISFPPAPRTARAVAHRLRCAGFYTLPARVWSDAADLAELLLDMTPTTQQRIWLWREHERFLARESQR